ncbi:hypothetical protein CCHR01_06371 [Colletotrichum chrysophilum]|uniref:Uncharacterized protein n=1 Tax=Colletotrichum chrysophilum TaxID=1836956 RepID=A0AAD9EKN8_9PEZI|nr:hypothetical protein CCHR01_06371 [Colletotrichum chrysophilum]
MSFDLKQAAPEQRCLRSNAGRCSTGSPLTCQSVPVRLSSDLRHVDRTSVRESNRLTGPLDRGITVPLCRAGYPQTFSKALAQFFSKKKYFEPVLCNVIDGTGVDP